MIELIVRHLATWSLSRLHRAGGWLGWLVYALSGTYRQRFKAHVALAAVPADLTRQAIAEAGRMALEIPRLWLGAPVPMMWDGAELIDAAHAQGRGLVFLTPHLGCFEVTAQAYAQRYAPQGKAVSVLFRPPRKAWLQRIVGQSRNRPGLKASPTTLSGVKTLVRALKNGEAVGLLPDQVPPEGLGVWAPFFGREAYTMTLPARLVQQTGAALLLIWGERLPQGAGYRVRVRGFDGVLSSDLPTAAAQINTAMEQLVRECPQQYLWAYARYKSPRAPDGHSTHKGQA